MFKRSGLLLAATAAFVSMMTIDVAAGDRARGHHHQVVKRIHVKNSVRIGSIRIVNKRIVNRIGPHRARERDVYSGEVAVFHRPGVGTWSYSSSGAPVLTVAHPGAKIIDIDKLNGRNDCKMEMGVCVIRP